MGVQASVNDRRKRSHCLCIQVMPESPVELMLHFLPRRFYMNLYMKRLLLTFLWRVSLTLTATYIVICLILFLGQRSLIYFPTPPIKTTSDTVMILNVPEASLNVSVRPHEGSEALIYFGGNAEDVSRSLLSFSNTFPNHAIYMLHYRGYGGSTGEPSEAALHSDAIALFEKVHATHTNILVIGRSLGSGVAIRLAATQPVSRLILITPYDSMETLAKNRFPFLPAGWILQDKFESWRYAPLVKVPTLIVVAENDELITSESTMSLLHGFASGIASWRVIKGVGHNSISQNSDYMKILQGY